jgi:hypothetical protein
LFVVLLLALTILTVLWSHLDYVVRYHHPFSVKFNNLVRTQGKKNLKLLHMLCVAHSLKFTTLYAPASVRNIRLLFRVELSNSSFLNNRDKSKVLVKQSYVILAWLHYLGARLNNIASTSQSRNITDKVDSNDQPISNFGVPGLFIYPTKSYKTTVTKAPMAHKTFSQEQFMFKVYKISLSFTTNLLPHEHGITNNNTFGSAYINSINFSIYYIAFLRASIPYISTNMLLLKRYTLVIGVMDSGYFSYFFFNH